MHNPLQNVVDYIRSKTSGTHVIFASTGNPSDLVMGELVDANISFKVLLGAYKDKRETSYLVGMEHLEFLFKSGLIEDEESILVMGNTQKNGTREAFLVFNDLDEDDNPGIQHIGFLDVVSAEEAQTLDGWSYDPTIASYFGIRKKAA